MEELLDQEGKLNYVELPADAAKERSTADRLRLSLKKLGFPPALLVSCEARLGMARMVQQLMARMTHTISYLPP